MRWNETGSNRMERLRLPQAIAAEISSHLRGALPNEGCGLLSGSRTGELGAADRFFAGTNIDQSPTRYTMHPSEVAQALDEMERGNTTLLAIVHSHPSGPATPSVTDLREFHYPGALMVIADVTGGRCELRAWSVGPISGRVSEVLIQIVP